MQNAKQTYNLFLDDIREPNEAYGYTGYRPFIDEKWTIVRNYDEFVSYIKVTWKKYNHFPELIAFDHDLADEDYGADTESDFGEKTGMDCARWLIDFCMDNELKLPDWICHSMNPAGRDNINTILMNFKKQQIS